MPAHWSLIPRFAISIKWKTGDGEYQMQSIDLPKKEACNPYKKAKKKNSAIIIFLICTMHLALIFYVKNDLDMNTSEK
jgi:hypothetical protein